MTPLCPRCRANLVVTRRRVQTTAATFGGIAGAIQGASTAVAGTEGSSPRRGINYPLAVIAGAILGGLIGSVASCAPGSALCPLIDQALPNNFRCLTCGYVFDANHNDPALT